LEGSETIGPSEWIRVLLRRIFPPLFTIRIAEGGIAFSRGKVPKAFLEDCSRISEKSTISSGWIWGHREGEGIVLEFSGGISPGDRQRFRNTAGIHRL